MQDVINIFLEFETDPMLTQKKFFDLLFESGLKHGYYSKHEIYAVTLGQRVFLGDDDDVEDNLVELENIFLIKRYNSSVNYPIHYNCFIDCENREFIREIVKHPEMCEIFISEGGTDPTEDIINSENKILLEVLIDEDMIRLE